MAARPVPGFDRASRYAKLPEQVAPDRHGRLRVGKALRPLPDVTPRLEHTVESSDRLDQLAYKYYRKSRLWWHILDANPSVVNPLDLLGEGPNQRVIFALERVDAVVPWSRVLDALGATPGVTAVQSLVPFPVTAWVAPTFAFELPLALLPELEAAGTAQSLGAPLRTALALEGMQFDGDVRMERVGEAAWRLEDLALGTACELRHTPGTALEPEALQLFRLQRVDEWALQVDYDALSVGDEALRVLIQAFGLDVTETKFVGRIGKPISIPARRT